MLVDNRTSLALQVNPQKLPPLPAHRQAELAHLGALAHMSLRQVRRTMHEQLKLAAARSPCAATSATTSSTTCRKTRTASRGSRCSGSSSATTPDGTLAAHVLGSVGEVSEEELKEPRYRKLQPGDEVGQGGVEYTYDRFLRGQPGLTRIQVNALGQPTPGGQLVSKPPVPGDSLKLTIDSSVQAAGEQALAARGLPGAFVTMNVHNGQILGLGSFPTYDPSVFTKPMTQAQVNALYRDPVAAPLTDRATQGLYPTGSTFKLITAMAALEAA